MIDPMATRPGWLELPTVRTDLTAVAQPIHRARRRLGALTAWAAILAVAGISVALRRRGSETT
jgi:hypothetical protein